jgi:alpha-glucosidase
MRLASTILLVLITAAAYGPASANAQTDRVAVASPDGRLEAAVTITADGVPHYRLSLDGQMIVPPSRLGVVLAGGDTLGVDMTIAGVDTTLRDRTWTQPWGATRTVRDHHREARIRLTESTDQPQARRMVLVLRMFNEGLGLRYEWPEQPGLDRFQIEDELTTFRFAGNPTAWWIRAYEADRYEQLYQETRLSDAGYALHTPLMLAFPDASGTPEAGPHVAVHEAALLDYAAMSLRRVGPTAFEADLAPWSTGTRVYAQTPFVSPWRTVLVGDTAGDLVTNNMALNLSPPSRIDDPSWIQPGKYIGIWWAMHLGEWTWGSGPRHGATTTHAKRYIDFAAEHGFSGVLVEGWNEGWDGTWAASGWDFSFTTPYPDFDLDAVASYAREKGTRLIGHHETGGNAPVYEAQMDTAYALMASHDVSVIKTGYVNYGMNFPRITAERDTAREWNYGQFMVNHYRRSLESAAEQEVALNIHEPMKGTGLRRTYPNLLTREGARGQEFNAPWGGGNGPDHVPTLVFTRMLEGPMDFTPGIFDLTGEGDGANDVPTTLAGQLALYVVLYSPLQMAADLPENYTPHMDAFQFIKDVPVNWAETTVLSGRVGDYVTIARRDRHSADWYLGAKTDGTARTVDVPLDFLDADRRYTATIYRDAADADWQTNPVAYVIDTREVTAADRLVIDLAPGGGLAVRFEATGD